MHRIHRCWRVGARTSVVALVLLLGAGCSNAPRSLGDLAAVCVATTACDIAVGGVSDYHASCVRRLALGQPTYSGLGRLDGATTACVLSAGTNCDTVRSCFGIVFQPAPGGCTAFCQGDVAVNCVGDTAIGEDCLAHGPAVHCDPSSVRCESGTCSESRCEGRDIVECFGYEARRTCPAGSACAFVGGSPTCVGEGETCTTSTCEGDVLVGCLGGRRGGGTNCPSIGARCGIIDGVAECLGTGSCTGGASFCDGNTLTFCGPAGQTILVDCVAAGWARCAESVDFFSDASCEPPEGRPSF